MKISVIIPHCNEFQNLQMTLQSLYMQFRKDRDLSNSGVEIIVVDNRSDNIEAKVINQGADKHEWISLNHRKRVKDLRKTWLFGSGILKTIIYDDSQSHWLARQAGLEVATGEYVMFSDAHVLFEPRAIRRGVDLLEQYPEIGQVHGGQNYFFGDDSRTLYQYELQLEEKFWGRWTLQKPNFFDLKTPFKIPMSSQACAFYRRRDLLEWGGFPKKSGIYGGNEAFMAMRTWMMGKQVWSHPAIEYHHLAETRGYRFNNKDFHKNFMLAAYLLGGDKWMGTYYETVKSGYHPSYYPELDWAKEVCLSCKSERDDIKRKAKYSLDEIISLKPWDTPPTNLT